jgi:4-hydroxybenzoate polyprenyltransferase
MVEVPAGHPVAVAVPPRGRSGLRLWASALRVHQWSKNGLLLVPLFLSHAVTEPLLASRAILAFGLFCLVSSGTYLFNDLRDLAADRAHPTKRHRAIASGAVAAPLAIAVAVALVVLGAAGAAALSADFLSVLIEYVGLTLLYTLLLKREPLVDTMTIGGLFTLRIIAGMVVIHDPVSLWLCSFTMVLFTSLALAKRHAELVRAEAAGAPVVGRAYRLGDTGLTAATGLATALTSVVVMLLYMALEAAHTGLYRELSPLFLVPVVLAAWLARIWVRAHRGELADDPVIFALKDRVSWLHALAVVGLWALAIR